MPGTSVDTLRTKAAKEVFAKHPDIKIMAEANGMWSQAVARTELSKILATHSWDKIDGLWMQAGCFTANSMQLEAGAQPADLKPCAGEGSNGGRIQMLPAGTEVEGASGPYAPMGAPRISYASPPYSGGLALKLAVQKLEGKDIPKLTKLPLPIVKNDTVKLCAEGTWKEMEAGCNVFLPVARLQPGLVRLDLLAGDARDRAAGGTGRSARELSVEKRGRGIGLFRPPVGFASPMTEPALGLARRTVTKAYGATVALDGASFAVRAGRGACAAGRERRRQVDHGQAAVRAGAAGRGQHHAWRRAGPPAPPADAHRHGIQTAFQEMTLVRDLTVAENMLLPNAPTLLGQLRRRQGERLVAEHLDRPRPGQRSTRAPRSATSSCRMRQKIEIARAVFRRPRILLLDEPTSTLSGRDIDWLGEPDRAACARDGVTVVFISHRLPEVRRFCDRLTVLRNGKDIGTAEVDAISDDEVIRMIIGRSLAATFPPRPALRPRRRRGPVLEARGLATDGKLADAGFALRPGEILGVAGLQGMGQQELFLACFGMTALRRARSGSTGGR